MITKHFQSKHFIRFDSYNSVGLCVCDCSRLFLGNLSIWKLDLMRHSEKTTEGFTLINPVEKFTKML